jgi:hypothetical protein
MERSNRIVTALIGTRLELPRAVLECWPELGAVRWRRGGAPTWIPSWFFGSPRVAITLWSHVFVGRGLDPTPGLLLHELRHVQQFQSVRAFPLRYLWELLRRGYVDNRFEADARAYAARRLRNTPLLQEDGSRGL